MNTEKINKLIKLVSVADTVVVDNGDYVKVKETSHPIDEPENEVILLGWVADDMTFEIKITELGLSKAIEHPDEGAFYCEDHEGNLVDVKLFKCSPLTW